jgi:hypothetical protein
VAQPNAGRCPHTWQSSVRGTCGFVLAGDTPRTLNFRRSQVTKSGPEAPGIEAAIHSPRSRFRRNRRRYLTTTGRNRRKAIIVRGCSRQCDKKQSRLIPDSKFSQRTPYRPRSAKPRQREASAVIRTRTARWGENLAANDDFKIV